MLMFLFYILSAITSFESLPVEIKDKLQSEFSSYKRVEFEVVNAPQNFKTIKTKEDDNVNVVGSMAYLPVNIIDKNGKNIRTNLSFRVKIYDDVYVAMKNIEKRDQLLPTDFQLVEKEITSVRGKIINSIGAIIGARASRFIGKGDILINEATENLPAIYAGNKVNAASIIGNVQISFSAIAKQEGSIGDIIRIKTNTNDVYKAEIIDSKNVLVIE
jgi:flagella basal body P-ring formation protein FlgA